MPGVWSEIGFEVEKTGDGSPSLRMHQGESMHHSGGAAAETELIYGSVIQKCFKQIDSPHFLSVGLGLGYVELTIAREAILGQNRGFTLESYERISELKEFFRGWLAGEPLAHEVQTTYDQVAGYVLKQTPVDIQDLKAVLIAKFESGEWRLRGALDQNFEVYKAAHGLLFDAFSSKTNPELWSEEFLVDFFNRSMSIDSLISTYACRGSLKRALARASFHIQIREGFMGKRNSTLGYKGLFAPANFLT
ncbi:MAG: hypothetical protein IPM97_05970 [Bdellovibrionaceae bacterium]|nr:hypothetical protein [Pseudobdellovibrionaceae bacterium]